MTTEALLAEYFNRKRLTPAKTAAELVAGIMADNAEFSDALRQRDEFKFPESGPLVENTRGQVVLSKI